MSVSNIKVNNFNDLYCKKIFINSSEEATSSTTGAIIVDGGIGCYNIVANSIRVANLYADSEYVSDIYHITATDESTSTSSGSFITDGGVGIAKAVYIGGVAHCESSLPTGLYVNTGISANSINATNSTFKTVELKNGEYSTLFEQTDHLDIIAINHRYIDFFSNIFLKYSNNCTSSSTGSLVVNGGSYIDKDLLLNGQLKLLNTTNAVSTMTGSLIVSGGASFAKDVYINGKLNVDGFIDGDLNLTDTTDSSSISTGAIVIAGGCGVAKNCYIGGNCNVAGSVVSQYVSIVNASDPQLALSNGTDEIKFRAVTGELRLTRSGGSGILHLMSTTASTSISTGNLIVNGGCGVGGSLYANTLNVYGDMQMGTGAGTYHRLKFGGGNNFGYLYGAYTPWGDNAILSYGGYYKSTGVYEGFTDSGHLRVGYNTLKYSQVTNSGVSSSDKFEIDSSGNTHAYGHARVHGTFYVDTGAYITGNNNVTGMNIASSACHLSLYYGSTPVYYSYMGYDYVTPPIGMCYLGNMTVGSTSKNWTPSYSQNFRLAIPYTGLYQLKFSIGCGISREICISKDLGNDNDFNCGDDRLLACGTGSQLTISTTAYLTTNNRIAFGTYSVTGGTGAVLNTRTTIMISLIQRMS